MSTTDENIHVFKAQLVALTAITNVFNNKDAFDSLHNYVALSDALDDLKAELASIY